jgi:hypothetical protein
MFHISLLVPFSSGVALALILLRPSSEALLRARAPGAGDQRGFVSLRYSFTVIVIVIGFRGLSNSSRGLAVHHFHASKDFAEDGLAPIEATAVVSKIFCTACQDI